MAEQVTVASSGVEVRGVSKAFGKPGSRVTVLHDINLTINSGEFVSVIGPSGCGKSTLLKVVAGLVEQDEGTVTVGGKSVKEASRDKLIGLVPQSPALLPWKSVIDNVKVPLKVNRKGNAGRQLRDPAELLQSFGLGQAMNKFPGQLSGGMQQRAAIARGFVFDPTIMLMDEPFSALDEINRDQQRIALLDFWQSNQKSVMFVTHSVPEAIVLSDRIVVMAAHPGRIAEIIDVNLSRPRTAESYATEEFRELEGIVRRSLHTQMEKAYA